MGGKWSGLVVVVAEVVLLTLPVAAQDRANGPDQELVTRLHQLGQDEIAMAQLGESQGVSEGVRNFAAALASEQRASDARLVAYAQQKGMDRVQVSLPGGALEHGVLLRAPIANSPDSPATNPIFDRLSPRPFKRSAAAPNAATAPSARLPAPPR